MKPLNIVFVTQNDPFYVRIFFEEFMRIYSRREDIKAVVIAPAMGKKSFGALLRQMFDFYGPINFVRVGIKYVFYKLAAKLPNGLRMGRFYSVQQVCERYGVRVVHVANINAPAFLQELATWDVDLVISVAAPQIFREALISLPHRGCINIHNAKLPKYRGMLPNFWQMYNGEKAVGTTVHRINAGLDDGDILLQKETPIEAGESLDSLIRRTKCLGAHFMVEALEQFRSGEPQAMPNLKEEATYFTFPTRADVKEFRRRGYRLI